MNDLIKMAFSMPALALGLFGLASAAHADTYDFTLNADQGIVTASGSFSTQGPATSYTTIDSVVGQYSVGSDTYIFDTPFGSGFGNQVINATFYNSATPINMSVFAPSLSLSGFVPYANGQYSGNVSFQANDSNGNASGIGDFMASLATPSGGSSPSGGAPSPEVNTLLGFLIVGGTVAFLKRKRKGDRAAEEVAAV